MTDDELHDLIEADAAAKALADLGDDAGAARAIESARPPVPARYLSTRTLIYFGAVSDVRARMQQAAADDASPVQSMAISYMDMIRDFNSPGLDMHDPAIVDSGGMLDAFTAAGVFAAEGAGSKAHLLSMVATTPAVIDPSQVSRAWSRHRPDGKVANDA